MTEARGAATADDDSGRSHGTATRGGRTAGGRLGRAVSSDHGAAYEGAMEAVLAILISVGLGYWADSHFGTGPIWLIVGAVVGFAAFVLRLLRLNELVQKTAAEAEAETQRTVAERSEGRETILGGTDRRPSDDDDRPTETQGEDPADR